MERFFWRRSFCSWICPIGTVSEWIARLGKKLFRRNFEVPTWLVWLLTPIKSLLWLFFLGMVIVMPTYGAIAFLNEPYNKISDVKMLTFFLDISGFGLGFLIVMFMLSLFFRNFWCRFLCPYGAFIGLGSIIRISKVSRNEETCTNCEMCTKVCPSRVKVHKVETVNNLNCTACMACVEACPVKDTLNMTL